MKVFGYRFPFISQIHFGFLESFNFYIELHMHVHVFDLRLFIPFAFIIADVVSLDSFHFIIARVSPEVATASNDSFCFHQLIGFPSHYSRGVQLLREVCV